MIRIVLQRLRGEDSIAEPCRRAGIATSPEVKALWREALALTEAVADLGLENRLL